MQRREFITFLGGVSVAWPRTARAQQPARRVGVLMNGAPDDAEVQARLAAFLDGLQMLGWTDGRNVLKGNPGAVCELERGPRISRSLLTG